MRIVSGGRFTIDGRWVVVARVYGSFESIVYDPDNGPGWEWLDLMDCLNFVKGEEANAHQE